MTPIEAYQLKQMRICPVCGKLAEMDQRFCSPDCAYISWEDTEEARVTGN